MHSLRRLPILHARSKVRYQLNPISGSSPLIASPQKRKRNTCVRSKSTHRGCASPQQHGKAARNIYLAPSICLKRARKCLRSRSKRRTQPLFSHGFFLLDQNANFVASYWREASFWREDKHTCAVLAHLRCPPNALIDAKPCNQAVEPGAAGEDGAKGERPAGLRPRQHGPFQVGTEALAASAVGEGGGRARARRVLQDAGACPAFVTISEWLLACLV